MYKEYHRPHDRIHIGRQGEHNARQICFDISCWGEMYGTEGRAELIYQRPKDATPYPVVIQRDGSAVIWTVTSTDTANNGYGRAELRYYIGDTLAKSATSIITVSDALDAPGEVPDPPGKDWLDQVLEAAQRAEDAANRAECVEPGTGGTGSAGKDGATFTPVVSEDGTLSWTNNKGLDNPAPVNIKGPKGNKGDKGDTGADGGYYTPKVSQPTAVTMQMAFTPSRADMPAVAPVNINLPVGSGSAQNINPVAKTDDMTQPVGVGSDGRLWVAPIGGGTDEPDTPVVTTHGIVWDLINVTSSNPVTSVNHGATLSAVLTASDGYTLGDVTVTMGGEGLTGVWNIGTSTVTIASVTGDVVISCAGVKVSTETVSETLDIVFANGYPNTTTFAYNEQPSVGTYTVVKPGKIKGGLLRVDYDKEIYNGFQMNLYLFDADGKPYLQTDGSYSGNNAAYVFSGDMGEINYEPAGNAGGFGTVNAPFTVQLPKGCTVQACMRKGSATGPGVNGSSNNDFTQWAYDGGIVFTVSNEVVSTASVLSVDADYAMDYAAEAVATASIMGDDIGSTSVDLIGIDSEFAAVIDAARKEWMREYGGSINKIPIILHTDQHGRLNYNAKPLFDYLGETVPFYEISKFMNLGDTVSNWTDADADHPLLVDSALEAALDCVSAIPYSKRLDVFGNHDACILVDGALTCTENQAHLQHYFKNIYARRTNNYGYFTVKDDYFNVKYVVLSAFNNGVGTLDAKQLDWLIDTLKENDGYDVVIVAHMPLLADSSKWNFPTDTTYDGTGYRWCNADTDALFAARKAKTSGSVTDANGVAHPYDFSDCTTEMLCSIHGHTHADAYLYLDDFLVNTFDMFTDSTFFMVLIDRENRQLNVWKVCNPDTGATYQNYQIPLDKPAE